MQKGEESTVLLNKPRIAVWSHVGHYRETRRTLNPRATAWVGEGALQRHSHPRMWHLCAYASARARWPLHERKGVPTDEVALSVQGCCTRISVAAGRKFAMSLMDEPVIIADSTRSRTVVSGQLDSTVATVQNAHNKQTVASFSHLGSDELVKFVLLLEMMGGLESSSLVLAPGQDCICKSLDALMEIA
eukprot:624864-Amphidinium_carterae.1